MHARNLRVNEFCLRVLVAIGGRGPRCRVAVQRFERVRACPCRNGGETQSSRSSDVRKRIPEVKRYFCPINDCLYVTFWLP